MRKTKIICTMGPATDDIEVLRAMARAGMNVARFNFPTAATKSTSSALTA